jgi:hypothetical protein
VECAGLPLNDARDVAQHFRPFHQPSMMLPKVD